MSDPRYGSKQDQAALDVYIAAVEHQDFSGKTPGVMKLEHDHLVGAGLLDEGQPTRWSHWVYQQAMRAEFSPEERAVIRAVVGLDRENP